MELLALRFPGPKWPFQRSRAPPLQINSGSADGSTRPDSIALEKAFKPVHAVGENAVSVGIGE